jgi:hypothetical protein
MARDGELIAPRWYRRVNLWLAVMIGIPALLRLASGPSAQEGWWFAVDVAFVVAATAMFLWALLAQGVMVTDEGVRTRRPWTSGRRTARWDEVVEIRGGHGTVPVVDLEDGSKLPVTDAAGDSRRVAALLRERYERWRTGLDATTDVPPSDA